MGGAVVKPRAVAQRWAKAVRATTWVEVLKSERG